MCKVYDEIILYSHYYYPPSVCVLARVHDVPSVPRQSHGESHAAPLYYYYDDVMTNLRGYVDDYVHDVILTGRPIFCPVRRCLVSRVSFCYVTHIDTYIVSAAESYPIKITYHRDTGGNPDRCKMSGNHSPRQETGWTILSQGQGT